MAYTDDVITFGEMIQEICRLVGHPVPTDAAGSTDEAVQQMATSINRALEELLDAYNWQELTVRASFAVQRDTPGQVEKAYALPTDFHKFIDQTQWDATNVQPAQGPVSPSGWMRQLVRTASAVITLAWQRRGGQIYFLTPPASATTFHYMYLSKGMVQVHGVDADTTNKAINNDDEFVLDTTLILLLARAKYLEGKGFDSSGAMRDYLIAFNARTGNNKGAAVLSLNSAPMGEPLLDGMKNMPDTGYGS